jgi:hypothetical protein
MDRVRKSKSLLKNLLNVKDYYYSRIPPPIGHRVHYILNETDFVSGIESIELVEYTVTENDFDNSVVMNASWKIPRPVVRGNFFMNPGETKWWSFPYFEAKGFNDLVFFTSVRKSIFEIWEPVVLTQLVSFNTTVHDCSGRFLRYCNLTAVELDTRKWKNLQNPHYMEKDRIENRIWDQLQKMADLID